MKNVKISEILHLAADKYLFDGKSDYISRWDNKLGHVKQYSCDAVNRALDELVPFAQFWDTRQCIHKGFKELGLDAESFVAFSEFAEMDSPNEASQGARYAWLKFCAMLAEEQGV